MRFWDLYGVWIIAYVYLLIRIFVAMKDEEVFLWQAFLTSNLLLSLGVGYRALLRAMPVFGIWAPLVMRWAARLMLHTFLWFIVTSIIFSLGDIWDAHLVWFTALTLAGVFVAHPVRHDLQRAIKPANRRFP
jgi:hypothetical protein